MSIPRETLKWILSLDLSYPVKNVRRDFANGFLMAEILSRYYPGDVQMHSFENVASSTRKKQNWHLLEKLFKRKQIPVERSQIDAVMAAEGDAAVDMVQQLHEFIHSPAFQASQDDNQPAEAHQRQQGSSYTQDPRSDYAMAGAPAANGHAAQPDHRYFAMQQHAAAHAPMYAPTQPRPTGPAFSPSSYQQPIMQQGGFPQANLTMHPAQQGAARGHAGAGQGVRQQKAHAAPQAAQQPHIQYGMPPGMQQGGMGVQQPFGMQELGYGMQQGYGYPAAWHAPGMGMPPGMVQYTQQPGDVYSGSQVQGYTPPAGNGAAGYSTVSSQRPAPAGAAGPAKVTAPAGAAKAAGSRAPARQAAPPNTGYGAQSVTGYASISAGAGYAGAASGYATPAVNTSNHAAQPGGYAAPSGGCPANAYAAQSAVNGGYAASMGGYALQSPPQYGYHQPDDSHGYRQDESPGTDAPDPAIPFSKARPVEYQPYDMKDFEDKAYNVKRAGGNYWQLGRLGPDLETEELQAKREKAERVKMLAAQVREENLKKAALSAAKPRKEQAKEPTLREKAMQFAKNIPKPEPALNPDSGSSPVGSGAKPAAPTGAARTDGAKAAGVAGRAVAAGKRSAGSLGTPPSALQLLEAQHAEDAVKVDAIRAQLQRMM